MVFFASFFTAAFLCASVASAAPVPGNPSPTSMSTTSTSCTSSSSSTPCSTSSSSTSTPCTTSSSSTSTPCTTSSSSTSTPCTTSSSTSSAAMTYYTPTYGSGMSNWGGYNDCVSQCIAKNNGMKMGYYQKPTGTMESMSSTASGATHTVIVAPSQGVLRYVPMAVKAEVGDTIKFVWGANNHTVTKGSQLEPCNKTKDAFFTSGTHDKGFTFTQVVNDTNPTFFFCNTPGHCQKGMFGIINPSNSFGSPSCAKNMMPKMMKNSSTLASMNTYMNMMPTKSDAVMNWGNDMDMNGVPSWAQQSLGENIMYTRSFLAANPDVMDSTGKVDLSKAGDAPFVVPKDLAVSPTVFADTLIKRENAPIASSIQLEVKQAIAEISAAAAAAASRSSTSVAPSATSKSGGALSVRSSAGLVGAVVALAAFVAF